MLERLGEMKEVEMESLVVNFWDKTPESNIQKISLNCWPTTYRSTSTFGKSLAPKSIFVQLVATNQTFDLYPICLFFFPIFKPDLNNTTQTQICTAYNVFCTIFRPKSHIKIKPKMRVTSTFVSCNLKPKSIKVKICMTFIFFHSTLGLK